MSEEKKNKKEENKDTEVYEEKAQTIIIKKDKSEREEELESEVEDLRSKFEILAEQQLEKRMSELHLSEDKKAEIRASSNPVAMLKGIELAKQPDRAPAGDSPLAGQFLDSQIDVMKKKFSTTDEGIDALIKELKKDKVLFEKALENALKHPKEGEAKSFGVEDIAKELSLIHISEPTRPY